MPRGGFRPTAPQNNPANINPMGGNGQSGRDYTGFAYGENKAINEQQASAPMAASSTPSFTPTNPVRNLPQATPLTAPTQRPDEPVTAGSPTGPGAGTEALMLPSEQDTDSDRARLISYLPALEAAAQSPNSTQAFRNYVRVLRANLL